MPTVFSHALVAVAAGHVGASKPQLARFWILAIGCSLVPDADVLGFWLGIPYAHPLGHRGFFHSPFFGVMVGLFVTLLFFKDTPAFSRPWWRYFIFFSLITASHGVLDALTDGGLGIALLAPFDNDRYFLPWRPILVSPIGPGDFFSARGLATLRSEMLWIWLPFLLLTGLALYWRIRRARPAAVT